ncbi:MAG: DNA replication terminus site-binding protein [Providencia sp.]|uniref:DNA replication terminus site-binding protein n=1 Tax=Providencia sp. TaxID=589 RepID=UPI001B6B7F71|nr:DNA replication terminus site-binding protein [Providencia sp.]MBP6083714.1 DNA replication terminus site-binding protein [Providencia sp.]
MNNVKQNLIDSFILLEGQLIEFRQILKLQSSITAKVFRLPEVMKGDENSEVSTIIVDTLTGQSALNEAIQLIQLLFIHHKSESVSNKSAIRLPGAICIKITQNQYLKIQLLIDKINTLKTTIKKNVTQIDEAQRFEFIRESLHGLLTLNTYRTLTSLVDIDTVRFGWANKKVINKVTKEDILNKLQANLESGRGPINIPKKQWLDQLMHEISMINSLPHNAVLKTQRPVKVQPIARVWDKEKQKQTQFACATPLFIFAVDKNIEDIIIGDLPDYSADNIAIRYRPRAKPVELIIPRLNLYIER